MEQEVISVLIVDDNMFVRKSFREILKMHLPGMRIRTAGDRAATLRCIRKDIPHIIFMDIQLPGESGIALTREIKTRHPGIIICMFTNHDLPEYRAAARRAGADCFLVKDSLLGSDIARLVTLVHHTSHGP